MELKPRLRYCDVFGNPRKDLSLAELRELQREVEAEAYGPDRVITKGKEPTMENLADAVVRSVLGYVKSRVEPLERRLQALEAAKG